MIRQKRFNRRQDKSKENEDLDLKEEKILNNESTGLKDSIYQTSATNNFFIVADIFEAAIKELKFDENYEKVLKRLQKIQNVVKQKQSSLEKSKRKSNDCLDTSSILSETKNLFSGSSESLALATSKSFGKSTQSLCSISTEELNLDDKRYQDFLINVSCPFCSVCEKDKNYLVKHLDNNCIAFRNKSFVKDSHVPYSVFQILPNNTFKCNVCINHTQRDIQHYFVHMQNETHRTNYNKASSSKKYVELVFCSCCKIQVPNNATQIQFHIGHETHLMKSENLPNTQFLSKIGVCALYCKSKKFKCIFCSQTFENRNQILNHFAQHKDIKNYPIKFTLVHCMFCKKKIGIYNMVDHLKSIDHIEHSKEIEQSFELCFYCGFNCTSLRELALHMESQCRVISNIRKTNLGKLDNNEKKLNKTPEENKTKRETSTAGRYIVVEGFMEITDLFNYFKKLGEITRLETSDENRVIIEFKEDKTVADIMFLREVIEINGVKPQITTGEKLEEFERKLKRSESLTNPQEVDTEEDNPDGENDDDTTCSSNNASVQDIFSVDAMDKDSLEKLFRRVSNHLSNTTLKISEAERTKIVQDLQTVLGGEYQCVGFLECGLAFPVENFTLYCNLNFSRLFPDGDNLVFKQSITLNNYAVAKIASLLSEKSSEFMVVQALVDNLPQIKFKTCNPQKMCTLTFMDITVILTEIMRNCLVQNEILRPFILILRFWVSVHNLEIQNYEYVLISLILFFVMNEGLVNINVDEYIKHSRFILVKNALAASMMKDCGKYIDSNAASELTILDLFMGFLRFLSTFDFNENAICVPFDRPIPKTVLLSDPFKRLLGGSVSEINEAPICIMDTFIFNNLARHVKKTHLKELLSAIPDGWPL